MTIDVIRTEPERTTGSSRSESATTEPTRQSRVAIDVSDVSAGTVAEYARDAVGTDVVHLERRAGRTYLVVH